LALFRRDTYRAGQRYAAFVEALRHLDAIGRAPRVHRLEVERAPERTGADTLVIEPTQEPAHVGTGAPVEEDGRHPVGRARPWRLADHADAGHAVEQRPVVRRRLALGLHEALELLELGDAEGGLEIGETVVVARLLVDVLDGVRARLGRQ